MSRAAAVAVLLGSACVPGGLAGCRQHASPAAADAPRAPAAAPRAPAAADAALAPPGAAARRPAPSPPGPPLLAWPAAAGALRPEGATRAFDRATIFDYLDGGAEVYLAFGMVRAEARRYSRHGADAVVVDVFDMGSAAGAYGLFAFERESGDVGVGRGSELAGGLLRFWQDRFFVALTADDRRAAPPGLLAVARRIAAALPAGGKPPALVAGLPAPGLVATTVRYLPRAALLDHQLHPSARGPFERQPPRLGLDAARGLVLARYRRGAAQLRLVVARHADPAAAAAALARLVAASPPPDPAHPAWTTRGRWTVARVRHADLILVLDAPTRGDAEALAAAAATTHAPSAAPRGAAAPRRSP